MRDLAGNRWLDAELNSIYCVLTMLFTFNMLSSKCDNVNKVKPGTSGEKKCICHLSHSCVIWMVNQFPSIQTEMFFCSPCFLAAYSAQGMPITSYSKLNLYNKLQHLTVWITWTCNCCGSTAADAMQIIPTAQVWSLQFVSFTVNPTDKRIVWGLF